MGEEAHEERRRREMHSLSLEIEKYPRDLLKRFMSTSEKQHYQHNTKENEEEEEENEEEEEEEKTEELELNLGLSLGGRFGVDKNAKKKKLMRSSSIAGTIPILREEDVYATTTPSRLPYHPTLIRTSSLPTETEEEWRKRKELQTLRRMEAKRRRSEKQRNSVSKTEKMELNLEEDKEKGISPQFSGLSKGSLAVGPAFWAVAAAIQGGGGGGGGKGGFYGQPNSQGSVESQGGSSSGISADMESRAVHGSNSCGEARSPASNQSLQDRSNQEAMGSSGTNASENACRTSRPEMERKPDSAEKKGREIGVNAMEDMPCVFTKGDGPNGRRIEGILYRYGKGEEVRIMCICHGSFLSPAEFVKHAGGGDVDHPLRHIVVNPAATSFL